jgi:retrotransposon-encoded endonuclease
MIEYPTKILQVNLNWNQQAMESALQLALELEVDLVLVQEPWIIQGEGITTRSINHLSFSQILPNFGDYRPQTFAYILKRYKPIVSLSQSSPNDPDLLVIDIKTKSAKLQVLNIYNEKDQANIGPKTLNRCLYQREIERNTVLVGDFNTHHPWWDSLSRKSLDADQFVDWIESKGLKLLNTPGEATFFCPNLIRESVLDLTLASSSLESYIEDWQVLREIGSNHFGVLFRINSSKSPKEDPLARQTFDNTKLANWELFKSTLLSNLEGNPILNSIEFSSILNSKEKAKETLLSQLNIGKEEGELLSSSTQIKEVLDNIAFQFTEAILLALKASIPLRKMLVSQGVDTKYQFNGCILYVFKGNLYKLDYIPNNERLCASMSICVLVSYSTEVDYGESVLCYYS